MNTTFTNYAEKKAKQILNLLHGYTKGIRITAILLLLLMGVSNAWAATIFNCGIEVNETWYKGTGTINSGNWLEAKTAFNNKDFGVITSLKFGGQYDTWDDGKTDECGWNLNNGIWITITTSSGTQKDNFKLSCYHSGRDGNNNIWKTTGKTSSCGDGSSFGRYTYDISSYGAGEYKLKASWTSPSSQSTQATASFTIPGFTTTSKSQTFDSTPVGNNNSKTISFGTHYGTALTTNNCTITGTNKSEFSVTSINASGVTVQFKPTSAGSKTATLTITDAHSKKCTITLSATATLPTYTVTFHANGHGTAPAAQIVSQGSKATQPTAPTATGYTFGGWYKESNCTNAFDFNTAINADITLYAKWTAITITATLTPTEGTIGANNLTFSITSNVPTNSGYMVGVYNFGEGEYAGGELNGVTPYNNNPQTHTGTPNFAKAGTYYTRAFIMLNSIIQATSDKIAFIVTDGGTTPNPEDLTWKMYDKTTELGIFTKQDENTYTLTIDVPENCNWLINYKYDQQYYTGAESLLQERTLVAGDGQVRWQDGAGTFTITIRKDGEQWKISAEIINESTTVYFRPKTGWKDNNPVIICDGNSTAVTPYDCNGEYYTAEVPGGTTNLKFGCDNEQTLPLTVPADNKVLYDMKSQRITKLYLKANSNWKADGARFAAYFFGNGNKWESMTAVAGQTDLYEVTIPTDKSYPSVIFCRMNPGSADNNFNEGVRWNQTEDLSIPTNGTNTAQLPSSITTGVTWHTTWDDSRWKEFTAPTYNITLDQHTGGTIAVSKRSDITLNEQVTVTMTADPGYSFQSGTITIGTQEPQTITEIESTHTICGPTTITATWKPDTHTVIFDANGHGTAPDEQSVDHNEKVEEPADPTANGYTFGGWYTDANCNTAWNFDTDVVTGNMTLYAKWTATEYTITYNDLYGVTHSNPETYTIESETITFTAPTSTRTGYTFAGWDPTEIEKGSTGNQTVTAQWKEITYAVTISAGANGSVNPSGTQQVGASGISVTATANTGYKFKNWTVTDGAQVTNANSATTIVTAIAEGTITANFEEDLSTGWYLAGEFSNKGDDDTGWNTNKIEFKKISGQSTGTVSYITMDLLPTTFTDEYKMSFKIVNGNTWYGNNGTYKKANNKQQWQFETDKNNCNLEVSLPGTYTFRLQSDSTDSKKYISIVYPTVDQLQVYTANPAHNAAIANWDWDSQNGDVYTKTLSLNANTDYTFKAVINSAFYGNATTLTRVNSSAALNTSGGNVILSTDIAGDYIFTFNASNNQLTVTYPSYVTLSDGVSEAVSSSQTPATLTSVPGQMVTATPTMDIGANGNTFCWKLYDKGQDIDHLETTVDINFISLGNGKITFELPKVTGTYYLQLTTHTGADCSDETLIETIICPINVSTENTVFFQDESGNWKNVYVYFYGSDGYWGTGDEGSGAREVDSYKMTKINGTNIFYYKYSFDISSKNIAFTDHNQGNGQGNDGKGYQWFSSCQVVYRSDFASCAPMFVLDKNHGVHHNNTAYYYTDGYWTTYMGTSSGYYLHINGNDVADPNHEMTTTTVGKRVYTHKVSLNGNQTPYELWFRGCNGTYYGVESNMTVTNCTEWNLYSGSASVNLYATAAGDYTFILYCNPDGHFQLSVEFPVAEGDYQLVYDDDGQQTPHPSDYIRSSTVDGKLDTVSMYIRGESGTGKTLKVQRCTGFSDNGNPKWTTLKTYDDDDEFSGLNLTKDTVYNFHMEQTVSTQTIDIKSTEFYSGKYYVRTNAADGGWDAYATESDNQMTYTEYSSHLPFDPYTHYFCKWVDDSNKDDVSYTIACDYAKALSDTLEGDNYTVSANSHVLPEKANVRFTYDNRTNGLKRAYLTGASDSKFDDFLKLTKTKDGTTMKPGQDASDVSHVKLKDEENWVYATEIYVTSAGNSFDAMLTAVYPQSAVNNPEKKQYFFAKKNDNGTYAGETLIGGTDGSEQLVTIRYDFKTNRLMRAWKPSGDIDDEELPLSADILLIREGQNAAEQLVFTDPTNNKITNVKTIFGALEFKYDNMVGKLGTGNWNQTSYHYCRYYVSFPFDVRISEIFGAGNYGEDYIIQKYNGTKRAEIGWFAETETFWETMDKSETLYKYEGYCVMLNRTPFNDGNSHVWKNKKTGSSVYLYFPSASHKDDWTISATDDVVIKVPEHQCNIDRDFTQDAGLPAPRNHKNTDSHWNMVGTPLFQNATAAKIADGPEVEEGDGYAEQGTRLQYVYDWVNTAEIPNGTAARKAWGTDFEFKAMHSYLIQFAGEVTFRGSHIANHVPSSVAARRAAEEVKNYTVELQLDRDSAFASRTYVELQENAEDGFLLNEDMYMGSSSPIANLYTYAGAYDVAANVLSVNSHIVPVGVQVKQAGTYTFSMTTPFDGTVTLIDYHTGSRTNLGWSDYTVTLEKGTINDRFALEINIQHVSTDVEGNTGHFKGKDAVKFLHNGILYIKKGDAIYDARGSRVSMSYEL